MFVTALCDLGYTIHEGLKDSSEVAQFQYLSPAVLSVSMVRLGGGKKKFYVFFVAVVVPARPTITTFVS